MTPARALILTAGLGTRLRPLTCVRAKPAVPVNGEPLARRIIRWLVSNGVRDLVLNLHSKPHTIARVVGDGASLGARVRYSWEQPILGSAGGPRHALPLLAETFLLVNGDTLTDVDLDALARAHRDSGAAVTMALVPNPRPDKYGGVRVSAGQWVAGFTRPGSTEPSFHFIGAQMASRHVFAGLEDGVPAESVSGLYAQMIARDPRAIRAFLCDASFLDIGTAGDYLATSIGLARREGDRLVGDRVRVGESARVERTAVWDDVVIGPGASLVECVVADGVRVPAGARYERCALVPASACGAAPGERTEGDLVIAPI